MTYRFHFSLFDPKGQRKYLNQIERRQFFEFANARKRNDVRLFCLLLFYTGARISEVHNLTTAHIDFSNKSVTFRTLKKRRNDVFRQIPLPDHLLECLENYIDELQGGEPEQRLWLFSIRSASRYVKSVMLEAGISGVKASALGLRHGFAVYTVSKIPITQVQKWLGHASLQTTAIYLNICGVEERALAQLVWDHD